MQITIEDLVGVCPATMTPDESIFDAIRPQIDYECSRTRGIVTPDLFDSLDGVEERVQDPNYERLCALALNARKYICATALIRQIPSLDLVLTPTGFGVVSNQNVAPASTERVRSLTNELRYQADRYLDEILDGMRSMCDVTRSTMADDFVTLFWKTDHVRLFGHPHPTRNDLDERMPKIIPASMKIRELISPELYDALIKEEAKDALPPARGKLVDLCRRAIVGYCNNDYTAEMFTRSILLFLEDNIDYLPEYYDSRTFEARRKLRYENEKDDPCFFFG